MLQRVVVLGGGGFAREILSLLRAVNAARPAFDCLGCVVMDAAVEHGDGILGDDHWVEKHQSEIDGVVLGVGFPALRMRLAQAYRSAFPRIEWPTVIHPNASFDWPSTRIEPGVTVCGGVNATMNVRLRRFAMVHLNCSLGHETDVGEASVINPGANISGAVRIDEQAMVGAGAVVLQGRRIGARAVVGAGAVVTRDVAPGQTVVGVPARPMGKM